MFPDPQIVLIILAYVVAMRLSLSILAPPLRDIAFALGNVITVGLIFQWGDAGSFLALYVAIVLLQFVLIRFVTASTLVYRAAAVLPIAVLALVKYLPESSQGALERFGFSFEVPLPVYLVGLSFMAFRLSRMAVEVRTGTVPAPNIWIFVGFAFFVPVIPVGPISTFQSFYESIENEHPGETPWATLIGRVLVGATKYFFLGALFHQLAFDSLMLDRNPHPAFDLAVASAAYYIFLYLNFSGFCDMAVGAAGVIGIRLEENFNHPFAARNIQDFWNRWHITLGSYMRIMVFTPLSKALVGALGPRWMNLSIAIATFVVFVLVGIWHGRGTQYLAFGVLHAIGVTSGFIYGNVLKARLGREGFRRYTQSVPIRWAARSCTFAYVSMSMIIFALPWDRVRDMLHTIKP